MVLLIIIPIKNGYFIGNINPTFSDKPLFCLPAMFQDPAEIPSRSEAWCCQIILPLIFLLAALLTMRFAGIGNYQVELGAREDMGMSQNVRPGGPQI